MIGWLKRLLRSKTDDEDREIADLYRSGALALPEAAIRQALVTDDEHGIMFRVVAPISVGEVEFEQQVEKIQSALADGNGVAVIPEGYAIEAW